MKPSLSRKRVKTDPAFSRTRALARLFGKAAQIASSVYRLLPVSTREKGLYRKLTGKAMQWLKEGHDTEQVMVLLWDSVEHKTAIIKEEKRTSTKVVTNLYAFANAVIAGIAEEPYDEEILLTSFCHAPP